MESGTSGLLDKLKVGILKILKKEQEESKKKQGKIENQEGLKQESWTDELRDLAPIDNVENFDTYEQTLNWAFQNERVKNIALSGPYGSGKSSIIETFLKTHPKIEESSIRVSLATFEVEHALEVEEDSQKEEPTNRKIKISEKDIEKAIVKQLFYKVDAGEIPQSRYRKLYPRKPTDIGRPVFFILLLIAIFAAIIKPVVYTNYFFVIDKFLVCKFFKIPLMRLIESLAFVVGVAFGIIRIYGSSMIKLRIKEINVLSNATVCDSGEDSEHIFDKDLDEIMYFFENTKYNTVFFEDLDRLETPEIFVHLRELNYLLNNDETIGKRVIRFVYAVKDNIFVAEDRAKFFDLIIPVIPVVNSTNSGEVILEILESAKKKGAGYNITKEFIFDIEPFVSDMRTLKSVYNEFLMYKKSLGEGQKLNLEDKKIFAMMVLKNTYPSEFYELQKGGGSITELLSQRKLIIEREEERLQSKIDELENVIKRHGDRTCESIKEVKWAMLCRLMNGVNQFERFEESSSGRILRLTELMKDEYDMNRLISDNYKSIRYVDSNSNQYEIKSITSEDFQPFITRYAELRRLETEGTKGAIKKIELIKKQKSELARLSLSEMFDNPLAVELFPPSLKDNKLLCFLIRRGYIGEDYDSYINNCRKISLSSSDMNFVLSIKSRTPLSADYSLKQVENILDRLQVVDLEEDAARNYDLLNYMLYMLEIHLPKKDDPQYGFFSRELFSRNGRIDNKLRSFIRSFAKWASESSDWICFFNEFPIDYDWGLIRLLAVEWKDMTSYILGKKGYPIDEESLDILYSDYDAEVSCDDGLYYDENLCLLCLDINEDERDRILLEVLWWCHTDVIKEQNVDGVLGNYLSENSHILKNMEVCGNYDYNHFKSVLERLDIKFNSIEVDEVNKDVLDIIFDGCYYHLNDSVLKALFSHKNPDLLKQLERQPYSAVLDLKDKNLLDYVHENFEGFIERCILTQKHPSDRPEDIVDMLRRLEKNTKLQKELIEKEVFQLDKIDDCAGEKVRANPEDWKHVWDLLLELDAIKISWENVYSYWGVYRFNDKLEEYVARRSEELSQMSSNAVSDDFIKTFLYADFKPEVLSRLLPVLRLKNFDLSITSMNEEMLRTMIECRYFPFRAFDYKIIAMNHDESDLALRYIIKNQEEYMNVRDEIQMSSYLLKELIFNDEFNPEYKTVLFKDYARDYMTAQVALKMNTMKMPVTNEIFAAAWKCISVYDRENLLLDYCEVLSAAGLQRYFTSIGEEYADLADRSRSHDVWIHKSVRTVVVASHLKNIQYITSFKAESRKVRTITHHELKLRVKKID